MKHLFPLCLLAWLAAAGLPLAAQAQTPGVGIGTTTPDASALLDLTSNRQGLLVPRLTAAQRTAIASPAAGLLVYQTDGVQPGFWYYAGSTWLLLPDKATAADNLGNHQATQDLALNSQTLRLRTPTDPYHLLRYGASPDGPQLMGYGGGELGYNQGSYQPVLRWNASGNVGIGTATPNARLDLGNGALALAAGLGNSATRPAVGTGRIAGEIAGLGGAGTGTAASDDGFLRLSAGGGTAGAAKSYLDLSGYSQQGDMYQNIVLGTSGAERLRVTSAGRVGIGTSNPNARLDLGSGALVLAAGLGNNATRPAVGAGRIAGEIAGLGGTSTGTGSGDDGFLRLSAGGGTSPVVKTFIDLSGYSLQSDMYQNIVLGTSGTERLRVSGTGNVGIGTSTPGQKLEVAGTVYSSTGGFRFPDGSVQTTAATSLTGNYIQNGTSQQASSSFNVSGTGTVGGLLTAGSVSVSGAGTVNGLLTAGSVSVSGAGTVSGAFTAGSINASGTVYSSSGGFKFPDGTVQTTAATAVTGNYIQNGTSQQAGSNFNVSGSGTVGGLLTAGSGVAVAGNTVVEFGAGVSGKAPNAGKIGYQTFTSGLDIVGAGSTSDTRKISFYNEGGAYFVGNIGIGTTVPAFPLDIQASATPANYNYTFFTSSGPNGYLGTAANSTGAVSIRTSGRVVSPEFNATSDRRLKNVQGLSDNAADLALLNRLRITDYTMRDRAQYGQRQFKKVIAQEVEQVFPQAVQQHTGFLPDVYASAVQVATQGDSLLVLTLPTALPADAKAGQRLKLIGPAGEVTAVVKAASGTTLTVRGAQRLVGQQVFVFGLEHPDVRTVDYEALAMLNVSATQELARQVRELEPLRRQVAALQAELAASKAQAAQQVQQAQAQAAAQAASLDQRLKVLEGLLGARAEAR